MDRIARFALVVVALASLLTALASTAGAVTWHNTGDTAFTATAGPTTITGTGSNGISCGSATVTGTISTSLFVGVTWPVATGTVVFPNCTGGVSGVQVDCRYTATANSFTPGSPSVSGGNIDLYCTSSLSGVTFCITEGTAVGTYTNPVSPSTFGKATLFNSVSNAVTVTNGPGSTCPLGNNDRATLSHTTYTITNATGGASSPHLGPVIARTS